MFVFEDGFSLCYPFDYPTCFKSCGEFLLTALGFGSATYTCADMHLLAVISGWPSTVDVVVPNTGQWQTERSSCSISRACWAGTTEMRIQKLRRSCSTSSLSWDRTPWGRSVDPGMGLMLREIQNGVKRVWGGGSIAHIIQYHLGRENNNLTEANRSVLNYKCNVTFFYA